MKKLLILILIISSCNSTPKLEGEYSCNFIVTLSESDKELENVTKGLLLQTINVSYLFMRNNTGILSYSIFDIKTDQRFTWNKRTRNSIVVTLADEEKVFIYNKTRQSWIYTTSSLSEEIKAINEH